MMNSYNILGRRGQEEEEECDIFATCVGYNDDDGFDEIQNDRSASRDRVQPRSSTDSRDGPVHYNKGSLAQENSTLQHATPPNENSSSTVESLQTSSDDVSSERLPNQQERASAPPKRTDGHQKTQKSSTTAREFAPTTQDAKEIHALRGRPQRGSRAGRGGAHFRRARGGMRHQETHTLDANSRRPCYFEHEDRLAEPDHTDRSVGYPNDRCRSTNDHHTSRRSKNLSVTRPPSDEGETAVSQGKWLHDCYEQLQNTSNPTLPLRSKNARSRGYRRRRGIYRGNSGMQKYAD